MFKKYIFLIIAVIKIAVFVGIIRSRSE